MAKVRIDLVANILEAVREFQKFSSEASKSLNSINLKTTISAVRDLGAIAASVGRTVEQAFSAPIAAASAQEDAINSLNVALATQGNLVAGATSSLEDYANTIQKTTKFSDDAVLSNLAFLESLTGLDTQGLQQASDAAINMAAALNIDLNSAFSLIAKAANGNTASLKRYGVEVKNGADDSETFANALNTLNRQFGGAAAGQVNTYSGAVAKAGNAFDDLLEEIGNVIIKNPVVIATINEAARAFSELSGFISENRAAIISFVSDALLVMLKVVPLVVDALEVLNKAFELSARGLLTIQKGVNFFTGLIASLGETADAQRDIADAVKQDNAAVDKQIEGVKESSQIRSAALKNIDGLVTKSIDNIKRAGDAGVAASAKQATAIKNQQKAVRELSEEEEKRFDALAKGNALFGLLTANPEVRIRLSEFSKEINAGMTEFQKNLTLAGAGLIASISKGAQGAKDLISGFAGNFAEALLPGLGGPVKEIVALLQEGPEKVRQMFEEFFKQLPKSLRNILDSIPVIIQTTLANLAPVVIEILAIIAERLPDIIVESINAFVNGVIENLIPRLPEIIARFASLMPVVSLALARSLIANAPSIARATIDAFIRESPRFISSLISEFAKQIGGGLGGGGSPLPGGGGLPSIGGLLGFASGGEIPNMPQFQNDGGLARVSAGENVIDQSTNQQLKQFLAGQGGGAAQNLTVNLLIGEEQLATAILNLNRQGFRLA